jgi:glycerophosphoryl diester phosphodiesterase
MITLPFDPPIIAHRGARIDAPENTLASISLAKEQGASWVEVDVKLTRDGVPILMHDDQLKRTTNGKGAVMDTDWADIQTLDAGGWFSRQYKGEPVPHLRDVIELVLDLGLNINFEIKPCKGRGAETTRAAFKEIGLLWPKNRPPPIISSFDKTSIDIARALQPAWPRSLAFDVWPRDCGALVRDYELSAFTVDADLLNENRLSLLSGLEMPVLAYTVNDPLMGKRLLQQGVAALFSDNPAEMIAVL